ncbi:MAG: LOG family protein [Prevotellaceae bacterium]|jgi:predicted Rossmann-fold nucleotide-binding protein|nr:LOG family protein [Prevotellaceae bacterium]
MCELGNVFIVLPGGYGTMDEIFDMTAGRLVGEHTKILFVLNTDGFYDNLQQLFGKMQDEKCIDSNAAYHPVFVYFNEDIFQNLFN